MDINFTYRESLKEYSVEENEFSYYMPYAYILRLHDHFKDVTPEQPAPVQEWYSNLKEIEKRVVTKKARDEEKLSSLW